jgi:hypothetical protein
MPDRYSRCVDRAYRLQHKLHPWTAGPLYDGIESRDAMLDIMVRSLPVDGERNPYADA